MGEGGWFGGGEANQVDGNVMIKSLRLQDRECFNGLVKDKHRNGDLDS